MTESSISGLLTELHCQEEFSQYNILLSKPIVQDSRYDFIADINGNFYKIQCKTASLNEDDTCIGIKCYTTNIRQRTKKVYTANEVDYFYTWYKNKSYLIPFGVGGNAEKFLRFSVKIGGNQPNILWEKDYELEKILIKLDYLIPQNDKTGYLIKTNRKKKACKCSDCGKMISPKAIRCLECNKKLRFAQTKSDKTPERNILKGIIRTMPFTEIGAKFGVSDNAVRKWCNRYNLPKEKRDITSYSEEDWKTI